MTIYEIKENNKKLTIECDDDSESPREWDNMWTIACWHRSYNLGDRQINSPDGLYEELDEEYGKDGYLHRPLFIYDHSGITVSLTPFGCRWDSGQVGVCYISKDKIKKEYGDSSDESINKALKYLKGEIEIYDQYVRGEVYHFLYEEYVIDCEHCKSGHWEAIDSCGGFYGYDIKKNGMLEHLPEEAVKLIGDD